MQKCSTQKRKNKLIKLCRSRMHQRYKQGAIMCFQQLIKKKRTIVILHQRLTSICAMYLCSGRTDGGGIGWIDRKYFCGEGTTNKETEGIELI